MDYSIIIPHYNSEKSLLKLIKTIPPIENLEVIVVDDKSTEKTWIQLEGNKDLKRIKLVKNTSLLKGAGVCRNIGLGQATGKYIIFADADDFFLENFIEILEKYKKTEFDIIYFMTKSCYSDTLLPANRSQIFNRLLLKFLNENSEKSLDEIRYRFIVPWSKIYKKDFIIKNNILFDEILVSNDVMFSMKTGFFAKNIKVDKEYMYCVTVTKGSLTKRKNSETFNIRYQTTVKRNLFLEKINKPEFCTTGLSYLISSRTYGLKKIIEVFLFTLKNIKYIRYTFKNILYILKNKLIDKKERKYFVK